jgi:hypothetical protein
MVRERESGSEDDEWMNKQTIFEAIVAAGIEEFPKINQRIVREIIVR